MSQIIPKKINLRLTSLNGNAFSLMGAFQSQARNEGWTHQEIDSVLKDAQNGDYKHLLRTLAAHCQRGGF
jgi:hypothetical protein